MALFDLGKYNEAIEAYDKAININPNSDEFTWFYKGRDYLI